MRYICLIAVLLALPLTASAQERRAVERRSQENRSEQRRSDERRSDRADERRTEAERPPSTNALPWWERQQTPWWERQQTPKWETAARPSWESGNQQPQNETRRRPRSYQPSVVYVLPAYRYFPESIPTSAQFVATPPPPATPVAVEPPPPPIGALRLEVEPKESLQIFVDGVYLGTPADLGDELELAPGTRRVELRARGYRSLTFSAEIVNGRSITYRGALDRMEASEPSAPRTTAPSTSAPPAPIAPAPAGSKIMYVIPGCYLGNVSPKNVTLPPGCDIGKLTTINP